MPLNALEIEKISKVAIDHYRKNPPVDQINVERPLLDLLVKKARPIPGGKEYIVDNIYVANGGNGQYWSGNSKVTYNTRNPNELVKYRWANFHDGFTINEDELKRAGITVNDDKGKSTATSGEALALTNMLESQFKALDEGAKDFVHASLWLDGSQSADATPGVDGLVSTTPATGTIGGLSAVTNTYWRNFARTGLATTLTVLLDALEQNKRDVMRTKGRVSHYFCGAAFYDALRNAVVGANVTQVQYSGGSTLDIDMATKTLRFDGVPMVWVPDFDTNFGLSAPTIPWTKRCYALDLRHLDLHRDTDDWMRMRYPGRPIDQYVYYYAMTAKYGMSLRKRNAQGVLAIA
ncbi:phage major capsid protein [Methylibium sp.]|uniref:phage major capsid protein n=1 Tax=Methylibium sp. TaxID=2067992 RepID=UPI0017A3692C|nr:phage major capsid protein [Methylibium sp.]MBA3588199.1 phage major capsid protein [Methylibium sp.]